MYCCRCITNNKWIILIIVAGLNFTNAAMWISFAPITNLSASYYGVTNDDINWFSLVFFITTIPLGLLTPFIIDKFGLHNGIRIGAFFNIVGALLRIASTADVVDFHAARFQLALSGQILAGLAQPFVLIIPTKLSEAWFPEAYRTIATSISSMANPLGVTVSSLLSPYIVTHASELQLMNIIWGIASCVFGVAALLFICSRSHHDSLEDGIQVNHSLSTLTYRQQMKLLLLNRDYIVLLITLGAGIGLVSCLSSMLQQMLCPKGYSNRYAGVSSGLMTGLGIIGAGISSLIADRTKKFIEISKVLLVMATFAAIGFAETLNFNKNLSPAILCAIFGFFGFAAYPVCLELSVECSYPVNEALSSGLIVISGQVQGIIFIVISTALGQPLSSHDMHVETCTIDGYNNITPLNMNVSALVMAGISVFSSCLFLALFHPPYKRMEAEYLAKEITCSEEIN